MSKYLTLLLILTLMLPPLQAESCAMGQVQPEDPQGHQHAMDSDMPMAAHAMAGHERHRAAEPGHANGQSSGSSQGQSGNMSGCCDKVPAEQNQDCSNKMDCGSCSVFASLVSSTARVSSPTVLAYYPNLRSGLISPSHSYPPFRPPIS